jgi:ferredoxin-NADP reductase
MLDDPVFYLSGPPQMLTALTVQLHERGVPPAAVRIDAWE